jgi:RNA polymerase sigma factor (sigma-70 family)
MPALLPSPASDREAHAIALAHTTAARWFGRGAVVPDDDILGAALAGAAEALARYNERESAAFRSWAITRIRGEIVDELRRWDYLTPDMRKSLPPTDELPKWLKPPLSLDWVYPGQESDDQVFADYTQWEFLTDTAVDVEALALERLEPEEHAESAVTRALACLDAEERDLIDWLFWRDGSLTEWGERRQYHRNTCVRRRESAFGKLRRRLAR